LDQHALVAAVAVLDLADQDRETDLALTVVVGRGNFRMIQKREDLIPVLFQPPGQAARAGLGGFGLHEFYPILVSSGCPPRHSARSVS